jgi:hypothetical protein
MPGAPPTTRRLVLQEIFSFLLSPEARDLRPLLVSWLTGAVDLVARDRLRKAYAALPSLAPRLPLIGECCAPRAQSFCTHPPHCQDCSTHAASLAP